MKNQPAKAKRRTKLRIFLLILLVLFIAGATWGTIAKIKHTHAVNQERTQFTQAEKDLDTISSNIIAKFGTPEQNIKSKNCGHTSGFGGFGDDGDLYCYKEHDLVYPAVSLQAASDLARRISAQVSGTEIGIGSSGTESDKFPPVELGSTKLKNSFTMLYCTVSYRYYISKNATSYGYPSIPSQGGMLIDLDCSARPSQAQYFPLED